MSRRNNAIIISFFSPKYKTRLHEAGLSMIYTRTILISYDPDKNNIDSAHTK